MRVEATIPPGVVLLVAHDAGGAEILANWQKQNEIEALHTIDGPAQKIFRQRECPLTEVSLQVGMEQADWVLTGSGWGSDLEKRAVRAARSKGKFCVTFLDHWVNYEFRFELKGVRVMPDEIWVGDEYALAKARITFPGTNIIQTINPYVEALRDFFSSNPKNYHTSTTRERVALWVGENSEQANEAIYGDSDCSAYTDLDAILFFLSNLKIIKPGVDRIRIRPHPSQQANAYELLQSIQSPEIQIVGNKNPLEEEIIEADLVVGADSFALVVGILAGKRTISSIPPGGLPRHIPFPQIEDLRNILIEAANK